MHNKLEMMRIFCVAAESRNFKEAATQLGISPQAVTRAIKELEEQRGEILFYRSTRQIKITADGERLAKQARFAVESIDALLVKDTVATLEKSVFEQSIRLHEKIHGVVYAYVKENPESVEAKYIDKLYKATLNLAKKKPELFVDVEEMADGTMYWQTNVQEFIAEATTNPELVKVLASIDMEGNKVNITESLLNKLVKLVISFLLLLFS